MPLKSEIKEYFQNSRFRGNNKLLLRSLLILGLIFLSLLYTTQFLQEKNVLYNDYSDFYHSIQSAKQGKSLYTKVYANITDPKNKTTRTVMLAPNLNPPFFSLLIYPLAFFSFTTAFFIWMSFSILCGILSVLLLQKIFFTPYHFNTSLSLLLGFFIYLPVFYNFEYGQVSLMLLLFLTTSFYFIRENKLEKAAVILAAASALKPFLAIFFFYFLIQRQWRALILFCLAGFIFSLAPIVFFGEQSYADYLTELQHVTWFNYGWNASLLGLFSRMLPDHLAWIHLLTRGFSLFLLAYFVYFIFKKHKIDPIEKINGAFSLIIVMSLLISPLGWIYYFSWLIIPVMILSQSAKHRLWSTFLIGYVILFSSLPTSNLPSQHLSIAYFYTGALLLIVFLINGMGSSKQREVSLSKSRIIVLYVIFLIPSLLAVLYSVKTFSYFPAVMLLSQHTGLQ